METDNGVETEDFLNENSEGDELEEVSGYNEDDEADPEFDFDPEDTDDGQEEYTDADLFQEDYSTLYKDCINVIKI